MAYNFVGASSQQISGSISPATYRFPRTIAAMYRRSSSAGSGEHTICTVRSSTDASALRLYATGAGVNKSVCQTNGNGGNNATSTTDDELEILNQYNSAAGFVLNANFRVGWTNGTRAPDNTLTARNFSETIDTVRVGCRNDGTGTAFNTGFMTGDVAEVAIWNVELTDDEVISLSKGFKPTRIRPQSLVYYAPLLRNIQELRNGFDIAATNGPVVTDHPRVY